MTEPDYRAMWEELQRGVEGLSSGAIDAALLYPEQQGRYDSRGEGYDIVLEEMTAIRSAHEHVAWAKAPDPAHTPAARRVEAVSLRTIDASPYQVLIPEGAIGGRYSPEEAQRIADSITEAAKVAADPGLAIRRHGSPRRRFAVYPPLSGLRHPNEPYP